NLENGPNKCESAANRRGPSKDETYWKEINAAMALTNLAQGKDKLQGTTSCIIQKSSHISELRSPLEHMDNLILGSLKCVFKKDFLLPKNSWMNKFRSTRKPPKQTLEAYLCPDPGRTFTIAGQKEALDPVGQDRQPHFWLFALYKGVN
ncbi:hypothetical protein EK904_008125, partial [Melospiza melodia maxima]